MLYIPPRARDSCILLLHAPRARNSTNLGMVVTIESFNVSMLSHHEQEIPAFHYCTYHEQGIPPTQHRLDPYPLHGLLSKRMKACRLVAFILLSSATDFTKGGRMSFFIIRSSYLLFVLPSIFSVQEWLRSLPHQ
jgi:hypothetical protein